MGEAVCAGEDEAEEVTVLCPLKTHCPISQGGLYVTPNIHMMKPNRKVMVLGVGTLGGDWVMRVGPPEWISVLIKKDLREPPAPPPREDTARRRRL